MELPKNYCDFLCSCGVLFLSMLLHTTLLGPCGLGSCDVFLLEPVQSTLLNE